MPSTGAACFTQATPPSASEPVCSSQKAVHGKRLQSILRQQQWRSLIAAFHHAIDAVILLVYNLHPVQSSVGGLLPCHMVQLPPSSCLLCTPCDMHSNLKHVCRRGQVLAATVNEQTMVPFVSQKLNNLELALALAKRGNLPGAEALVGQNFDRLFASGQFKDAAEAAAESPQVLQHPSCTSHFIWLCVSTFPSSADSSFCTTGCTSPSINTTCDKQRQQCIIIVTVLQPVFDRVLDISHARFAKVVFVVLRALCAHGRPLKSSRGCHPNLARPPPCWCTLELC